MSKRAFIAATTVSLIAVLSVAGILLVDLAGDQEAVNKLYTYPLSAGEKTYIITVRTNWTYEPKVYLPEFDCLKYFCVDFIGPPDHTPVFFNITYPDSLIWGEFSLVWKYYEQSEDRYTLSGNGTHHSVYMTFNHWSPNEHFEIRGTEGAW